MLPQVGHRSRMMSSLPVSCHLLHCCCITAVLKWIDLCNEISPPGDRVLSTYGLVLLTGVATTGLSLLTKNSKTCADEIRDVRKRSRKSSTGVQTSSSGNQIGDSGSGAAVIELPSGRTLLGTADALRQLTVALILLTVFFHLTILLLGAPFTRHWQRTAALSAMVAVLVFVPLFHATRNGPQVGHNRADQSLIRKILHLMLQSEPLSNACNYEQIHAFFVLLGAWIGTLAMKLDWKQVWQEYPVSTLTGALIGSLFSHATYLMQLALRHFLLVANY